MVSKTYMVWLNLWLSWQTQQSQQYLEQGRDECFGCMFAVLHRLALHPAACAWC